MAEPSNSASTVGGLMSSPVVTGTADETIAAAAARMRENKVGSLVILDDGKVAGIFTERDNVRFAAEGLYPSKEKVGAWMTANPDTVDSEESVSAAFQSLAEHGYRHIPVVSDGNLEGIVSMRDLMSVARIQPVDLPAAEIPKGLEGVAVAETELGDVRGKEGFFHYRQYSAVELAEKRSLEDVWHLLYQGKLPDKAEREEFMDEVRPLREIPADVKKLLPNLAHLGKKFVPLEALRNAYSLFASSQDFKPSMDVSAEELRLQGLKSCAIFPSLLMALYGLHNGEEPIDPHPDLSYAANYLYMMRGEEPTPEEAHAVEQYLMLTIDHGFNASTFTARVITST
ncbi:MAG TPA: citrate/2-methylcitrate synthase, partial [Actinomycetota bacterium]|nr:citrate/2-methylcitrate synthase [Actinomycetota bacterium]